MRGDALSDQVSDIGAPNEHLRASLAVFCVLAGVAATLYLTLGRKGWFFLDEWDFLARRSAGSISDLLRPHNQHWTTVPILLWRALWQLVGLRSYLPYEIVSIMLHVAVAALSRSVMRRAGVRPWIATLAAGAFLFFGAGAQNIFSAFQIAFTGSLALGLAQLLLADHEGPIDRRDWFGLVAGALGLMCSGVAVAMVAVVGVATLLRRGPRVAAFHSVPLVALYLSWYARYGGSSTEFRGSIGGTAAFVRTGVAATFDALGQLTGAGAILAFLLVAGLAARWSSKDASSRAVRLAIPIALLSGTLMFFVSASVGHTGGPVLIEPPTESRYLYVAAALMMPALAVAVDAAVARSRVVGILAASLLLVGIPGNVGRAFDLAASQARLVAGSRSVILSIAQLPLSSRAPGSLRPDPAHAPAVTLQWLRTELAKGRLPSLHRPSKSLLAADRLRLSLMEIDQGPPCARLTTPVVRHLARGERIGIGYGAVTVATVSSTRPAGVITLGNVLFRSSRQGHTLVSVLGPLTVRISPARGHRAQLC